MVSEYSEQSTSGRVVGRYSLRDKKRVTIRIDDSDDEDDDESSGDSASTMPVEEIPHGVGGKINYDDDAMLHNETKPNGHLFSFFPIR